MDERLRFMADLIEPLLVAPGSVVRLSRDHDPGYTGPVTRPQADALLAEGVELLAEYQDRLAAQDSFGVLLVLQGLDASGKDSTIKHVMSGVNPQAVAVRAFKQPSAEELNHDYLWRYQCALPGRGTIGPDDRHDGRHQREPHDEGVQEHHPTGAERLAFNAVFFIPECLPDLVDLTDEELREALHTTMLRILRVPSGSRESAPSGNDAGRGALADG